MWKLHSHSSFFILLIWLVALSARLGCQFGVSTRFNFRVNSKGVEQANQVNPMLLVCQQIPSNFKSNMRNASSICRVSQNKLGYHRKGGRSAFSGSGRKIRNRQGSVPNCAQDDAVSQLQGIAVGGVLGAAHILWSNPVQAVTEVASSGLDPSGSLTLALGGGAALAALSTALVATDPQKRRSQQAIEAGGNEKDSVKNYFNTTGFDRWKKIYGETQDVNKVQLDIRQGHAETVRKVLNWFAEEGSVQGVTICDAGCGTGSLSIPLALKGAQITASDISEAMVNETKARYEQAIKQNSPSNSVPQIPPKFLTSDLEALSGKYDTVTCLDVMIHYSQIDVDKMITHLASLAENRLILSFAPKTLQYSLLKRIGELFPGPSKATRAYLHAETDVEQALQKCGWQVVKKEMTATSFYYSRLFEAVPNKA
eukprot:TRINITY_DN14276_c0_g3_i2.p1 TRINITY_DN14276_c0_g3~~TRINITY_DN14276_c0_g3_i2.p1  ORF type:complete len:426 (+),score=51.44 TRINITY_DN14276_c0_g3_i2:210-1487(+)